MEGIPAKRRKGNNKVRMEEESLPAKSVIFIEYSEGGILAKKIREVLKRMEGIIKCKVKVVERTGQPLSRQFPLTNLWEGVPCGREDCVTCHQGGGYCVPLHKKKSNL